MPKITHDGVSNRLVDEDFIAEPGTPVEKAIDEGLPDVGQPSQDEPDTEQEEPSKDGDSWDPARKNEPDNQTPAFTPKKSTPAKKK